MSVPRISVCMCASARYFSFDFMCQVTNYAWCMSKHEYEGEIENKKHKRARILRYAALSFPRYVLQFYYTFKHIDANTISVRVYEARTARLSFQIERKLYSRLIFVICLHKIKFMSDIKLISDFTQFAVAK